jgi:hypothetical protein
MGIRLAKTSSVHIIRTTLVIILIHSLCSSCSNLSDTQIRAALQQAGENRKELELVINNYGNTPIRKDAAKWLIANMPDHYSVWSDGIKTYADSVLSRRLNKKEGDSLWISVRNTTQSPYAKYDLTELKADFLIDNINKAFDTWEHSPWKDEVDYIHFRNYVLPYRFRNEILRDGWRDSLYNEYYPIVKDSRSALEAFQKIKRQINNIKLGEKYNCPYIIDVVALRNHLSGNCVERSIYIAGVCRAVGLPVTIDNSGRWANYSNSVHTWVSLILKDGTYTIIDNDSIAKKDNNIDGATFKLAYNIPQWYPYTAEFKKRPVKIWRETFEMNSVNAIPKFCGEESSRLCSPHLVDVSSEYGINNTALIKPNKKVEAVWLCSHALDRGWIPQAYSKVIHGTADFSNIADSVVLLPMGIYKGEEVPVGNPFFISNGKQIDVIANTKLRTTVRLTRKYPINAKWINRYAQIPTTRFEGCNNSMFVNPDTLFMVERMPVYHNIAVVQKRKSYRYIRVIADLPSYANMDHVDVYDDKGKLVVSEKKRIFELQPGVVIDRIEYFPWNDGNFVVPDHDYELVYWNEDKWNSLGIQHSKSYELTYNNVPEGALLLLHDLTEGHEERIFTMSNGKQIWW